MNLHQPGIVLLNKPAGVTSFQALSPIKKKLGTKKIGHSGTLDKFATGLMILFTNKATKLVPFCTDMDKTYRARIQFGVETDTLDPEGRVIKTSALPTPENLDRISEILSLFRGTQDQVPPMYSALHINGKRAYELARSGTIVEMKPRKITIYELTLHALHAEYMDLEVHCSKGTYIRSLARDISLAMGTCGHLTQLTRSTVGHIDLTLAVDPGDFIPERDLITGRSMVSYIPHSSSIEISKEQVSRLIHGSLVSSLVQEVEILKASCQGSLKQVFLLYEEQVVGFVYLNQGNVELAWNGTQGLV